MNTTSSGSKLGVVVAGLVVALMASGGAAGYFFYQLRQAETERELAAVAKPAAAPATNDSSAKEAARLREMLADKEAAYDKLRTELEALKQDKSAATAPSVSALTSSNSAGSVRSGGGRGGFGDDPDAQARFREFREQARQRAEKSYNDQLARLQARRQAAKSPEEIAAVDKVIASMTEVREIALAWESTRELSGEERAAQMRTLTERSAAAYRTYGEAMAQDRQVQLQQLAAQSGVRDAAQAKQFAEAIQRIYEETDPSLGRMIGFGGSGRRGGGSRSVAIPPGQ